MLPIWIPLISTLAAAIYASFRQQEPTGRTIEACIQELSSKWIKVDGVIRVYQSSMNRNCIVIECREPKIGMPTEVDDYPVRIKISPKAN